MIDASRRRGLTVGAGLSHTWIDKERTRTEFVDCVQRDIRGTPIDYAGLGFSPQGEGVARVQLDPVPCRHRPGLWSRRL